ncbi:hypothetical protein LTR95_013784 [Oleoguttula sp. CCFEE 5521]
MTASIGAKRKRKDEEDLQPITMPPPLRSAPDSLFVTRDEGVNTDESDEKYVPYNDSMEPPPEHPTFDLELWRSSVGGDPKGGLENIVGWADKDLARLKVKKIRIGIVGPTGSGADGHACTSVTTIYMIRVPGQTSTYAAEITYPTDIECKTLLSDRIGAKRVVALSAGQRLERGRPEMLHQDGQISIEESFRSLFKDKPEFASDKAAKQTLRANFENPLRPFLDSMVAWTWLALQAQGLKAESRKLRFGAETPFALMQRLKPLTISSL